MKINNLDADRKFSTNQAYKWMAFEIYPISACALIGLMYFRMPLLKIPLAILFMLNLLLFGIGIGCIGVHLIKVGNSMRNEYARICIIVERTGTSYTFMVKKPFDPTLISAMEHHLNTLFEKCFIGNKELSSVNIEKELELWAKDKDIEISVEPVENDYILFL